MDWLCGHFRRQHLLAIFGQGNALQSTDVLLLNSRVCGLSYIPRQFGFYSLFSHNLKTPRTTTLPVSLLTVVYCIDVFLSQKKRFPAEHYIHTLCTTTSNHAKIYVYILYITICNLERLATKLLSHQQQIEIKNFN